MPIGLDQQGIAADYNSVETAWLAALREQLQGSDHEKVNQMVFILQIAAREVKGCLGVPNNASYFASVTALWAEREKLPLG